MSANETAADANTVPPPADEAVSTTRAIADQLRALEMTAEPPAASDMPEDPGTPDAQEIPQTWQIPPATEAELAALAVQPTQEDRQIPGDIPAASAPSAPISRRTCILLLCAALLLIAILIGALRSCSRSTAVMLYIGDHAVGYITDSTILEAQQNRLEHDLNADGTAYPLIIPVCRTEFAEINGTPEFLSDTEIYDALFAHAAKGYVRGFALIPTNGAEGTPAAPIAGALTEAQILAAADAACAIRKTDLSQNLPQNAILNVTPTFTWTAAWISEDALYSEGALVTYLLDSVRSDSPLLSAEAYVIETVSERIPYGTTYVPNDEGFDGVRTMISVGADGLAEVTYTSTLDALTGELLDRRETARVIKKEAVNAVAYEGKYPLPDGVSTGTFLWPLPEIPDDDLPLDANGEPYTPENPLALKNTYISSGYGDRILWGSHDFHLGYDIVAPAYTDIYAADGGIVVYATYHASYGYVTRIRHANNVETLYAHQIKQYVQAGDIVEQGQVIGQVGSTGDSSGPHLHLEFRRDHVTVDPAEYITVPEGILVLGNS